MDAPAELKRVTYPFTSSAKRTYLNVGYDEKETAKELCARWDKERRQWYLPDWVNIDLLLKNHPEAMGF